MMATKVFWVDGAWSGRLGILPRPRGGDWLRDEARAWRQAGISLVVSLLESEEETQLLLADEAAAAKAAEVEFRAFPIPDRGVPASYESVATLATGIIDALKAGRNVAVHCRQGVGRSGLILGAVLVAAGEAPQTALKTIEDSRGVTVPETDEQRQWLASFASWLSVAASARPAATVGERRGAVRSGSNRS
jgi:protein-tyrosine phosphatase